MRGRPDTRTSSSEQQLAVELAALVLPNVAPDEVVVFDDSVAEYLDDPAGALEGARDTPLGSGIDVAMMTPYLLAVTSAVMPVRGTIAEELAKDVAQDLVKEPLVDRIRRLFRRPAQPHGPVALTPEQATRVHGAVVEQCRAVGLSPEQAGLIARASLGALYVQP
jgi:hypothetical protein